MAATAPSLLALLLALQAPAPSADAPSVSDPAAAAPADGAPASEAQPPAASTGAITPPSLVSSPTLVNPLPPDEARAVGPATVVVLVTIGEDGAVQEATVLDEPSHPDERLREVALSAAREARFSPALRDGAPLVVRLPFELVFQPPPPAAPPLVDGLSLEVGAPAGVPGDTLDRAALGRSLVVGGALMLGAGLLFTTFSGVTALDNATRQDELAKSADERAAAEATRAYGGAMLIPVAGPFLALPNSPDASTALFSALGGATHIGGLALLLTGGALALSPLFVGDDAPATVE